MITEVTGGLMGWDSVHSQPQNIRTYEAWNNQNSSKINPKIVHHQLIDQKNITDMPKEIQIKDLTSPEMLTDSAFLGILSESKKGKILHLQTPYNAEILKGIKSGQIPVIYYKHDGSQETLNKSLKIETMQEDGRLFMQNEIDKWIEEWEEVFKNDQKQKPQVPAHKSNNQSPKMKKKPISEHEKELALQKKDVIATNQKEHSRELHSKAKKEFQEQKVEENKRADDGQKSRRSNKNLSRMNFKA